MIDRFQAFIARRRADGPGEEYRERSAAEGAAFGERFDLRRVELGDCARPYGSSCVHEHACVRRVGVRDVCDARGDANAILPPGLHVRAMSESGSDDGHQAELQAFGLGAEDLESWRASGLREEAFVDWLIDRVARKPAGIRARQVYGAEDVHDFARRAILTALELHAGDRLLDVGCGGGLLLRDASAAGIRVTGLDHSPDMVELARERAPEADVVLGEAERLPFPDRSFDALAMSIVFFFLEDPVGALRECRRVLRPGGRLAVYTAGPEMRGTPADPEPLTGRGHFYDDDVLGELATAAGFSLAAVEHHDGGQLLTATA